MTRTALDSRICCKAGSNDIGGEHVLFYKISNSEESLKNVVEKYCENCDDSKTVGLIVANIEQSFSLSTGILKKGIPSEPPIYIVSLEDGKEIEALLAKYTDVGDLCVEMLAESDGNFQYKSSQPITQGAVYVIISCMSAAKIYRNIDDNGF